MATYIAINGKFIREKYLVVNYTKQRPMALEAAGVPDETPLHKTRFL